MANTLYQAALARPKTVSAHAFQEKEKIKKMKVKRDFNSNRSAFIYDTETASRTQSRQSNLSRKITERSCSPDSNKTPFISVKLVN